MVDVGGVGYGVTVPLSTFYRLPELGGDVELKVHTHFKDSSLELFGFLTENEKTIFENLIGIAGIGPKGATNILSNISPDDLVSSILKGDLAKRKVPGVGPKTASRIVNELKDKVADYSYSQPERKQSNVLDDVMSALLNLGYTKAEIDENLKNLEDIVQSNDDIEVSLRDCIKIMRRN